MKIIKRNKLDPLFHLEAMRIQGEKKEEEKNEQEKVKKKGTWKEK